MELDWEEKNVGCENVLELCEFEWNDVVDGQEEWLLCLMTCNHRRLDVVANLVPFHKEAEVVML